MNQRRIFIKQATPYLLAPIVGNFNLGPMVKVNQTQTDKRRILEEPGPMIPPVPAILLSVKGSESSTQEISVVWTFVINGHPPQIGISVGDEHVVLGLIKLHKEFVLNVPNAAMVEGFDKIDMNSSKFGDKFQLSGFTHGEALSVNAPTILESPIHVECRVSHELRVLPERTIFIADVVTTTVLPGVCDRDGRLKVKDVDFFGMTAGSGEFYTIWQKLGHIGKSVGRDDIKY